MKKFIYSKNAQLRNLAIATIALSASSAHAEVPAWATTALTTLQTDVLSVITTVGAIIGIVFGAGIITKLVKRIGNKI
jgi:hypothetical protein